MSRKIKAVKADEPTDATGARKAQLALSPSVNAAVVMGSYQSNVHGKDIDINVLVDGLRDSFSTIKDGDLSRLENMLNGQATALQSIFTSLARRAQQQQYQKNLESFLGLALKAQAQSRTTIQAIIELKFPRQVAFVKQANISHGPQQVNNGPGFETSTRTGARAEENQSQQSKLLEDQSHERTHLDTGATAAASIRRWKPWKQSNGPTSAQGKAKISGNAYTGGELVKLRECIKALNRAMREQKDWLT